MNVGPWTLLEWLLLFSALVLTAAVIYWGQKGHARARASVLWRRMSVHVDSKVRVLRKGVRHFRRQLRLKMDIMFDTYLNPDSGDFPNCDSPVWIFGRSYSVNYDLEELRRTVSSCMWVTYRKNFGYVGDTSLTSDKGWGCMIRTGQMLLAKALLIRHLGHDWHWEPDSRELSYLKIVSLFADLPQAPLSLHQIAQCGSTLGKPVGSWLGPNTVCQALKKLLSSGTNSVDLGMHIAMDSTLVQSEVKRLCLAHPTLNPLSAPTIPSTYIINTPRTDPKWKPLLLIVPLRLGLSDLNEAYVPGIKAVFEIPQTIGIIGGRPNHALYFIGYAENEVLYLDPHTVQSTVHVGSKTLDTEKSADETYHSHKPGRMPFLSMDPSIALCFFCKSESDFDSLIKKLTERFSQLSLPLFEICERRPYDWSETVYSSTVGGGFTSVGGVSGSSSSSTSKSRIVSKTSSSSPSLGLPSEDDEEFEILG